MIPGKVSASEELGVLNREEVLHWTPEERQIFKACLYGFLNSKLDPCESPGLSAESWIRFALDTQDEMVSKAPNGRKNQDNFEEKYPEEPVNGLIAEGLAGILETHLKARGYLPRDS